MTALEANRADAPPRRDAPALFREAILALERGTGAGSGRDEALRHSVRRMVDAFLAARGLRAGSDEERISFITTRPVIDRDSDQVLHRALMPGAPTASGRGDAAPLEKAYRALLPALRASLANELPGYRGPWRALAGRARSRHFRLAALLAAMVIAAAAAAYHAADPAYRLRLGGQIYWKPSPAVPFSEARSRRFDVRVDGAVHEYVVRFETPVRVSVLRLDPVDSTDATGVAVRGIRLLGADGKARAAFDFAGRRDWACHNCRWLDDSSARLQPTGDDPYIVGPEFEPVAVASVAIRMRATAEKTFWEWVTRLEKTDD